MTFKLDDVECMRRCFALARRATPDIKTNPRVGCVIIHDNKVIGEGYHRVYGQEHAEIDALKSVAPTDHNLLASSSMYVSLEPCHHHGKTPPCVDAIIKANIPRVVISCLDPNPNTHGKSVHKLKKHGVEVVTDVLAEEGRDLINDFIIQQTMHRPYIILKWAQSKDGYMGVKDKQIWLSNDLSKLTTHKWRSELDAIMVGTDTAITDNPRLTNRRGFGHQPIRIVLDRQGRLPGDLYLLHDDHPTWIFTCQKSYQALTPVKEVIHIEESKWSWSSILSIIYEKKVGRLLIEGGKQIHKSLIKERLWDEARIIHTPVLLGAGIKAPSIKGKICKRYHLEGDKVFVARPAFD